MAARCTRMPALHSAVSLVFATVKIFAEEPITVSRRIAMSRFQRAEVFRAVRAHRRLLFMEKLIIEGGYRPLQAAEINNIVERIAIDLALDLEDNPPEMKEVLMCASAHRLDAEMAAAGFAPSALGSVN